MSQSMENRNEIMMAQRNRLYAYQMAAAQLSVQAAAMEKAKQMVQKNASQKRAKTSVLGKLHRKQKEIGSRA